MGGGAFPDGFFGEEGLLADAVGDFGEYALVGADGWQVVGLAHEIEGAKCFPDLFVAGVDGGNFGAGGDKCSRGYGNGADASADGRADFGRLLAILQLGNQAALMDGGAHFVRVRYAAGTGSDDSGGLQEGDDLGTAGSVSKADKRKGGVAADHRGRILQHLEQRLVEAGAGSVL